MSTAQIQDKQQTVSLSLAAEIACTYWDVNPHTPVMMHGPTGVGKSAIFRKVKTILEETHASKIEKETGVKTKVEFGFIDFRASQHEASDLLGAMMPTEALRTVNLTPMDLPYEENSKENIALERAKMHFLKEQGKSMDDYVFCTQEEKEKIQKEADYILETDPDLPGYPKHGILFFDEIKHGDPSVQNALFGVLSDRCVGGKKLMDGWVIGAAGNRESEQTYDIALPEPLRARMAHIFIQPSVEEWSEYAMHKSLRPEVGIFLAYQNNGLHASDTDGEGSFPCGRQWEEVAKLLDIIAPRSEGGKITLNSETKTQYKNATLLQGYVGLESATQFLAYLKLLADESVITKYSIEEIIKEPNLVKPVIKRDDPGLCWALINRLLSYVQQTGEDQSIPDKKKYQITKDVAFFILQCGEGEVFEETQDFSRMACTRINKIPLFQKWHEDIDEDSEWLQKFLEFHEGIETSE